MTGKQMSSHGAGTARKGVVQMRKSIRLVAWILTACFVAMMGASCNTKPSTSDPASGGTTKPSSTLPLGEGTQPTEPFDDGSEGPTPGEDPTSPSDGSDDPQPSPKPTQKPVVPSPDDPEPAPTPTQPTKPDDDVPIDSDSLLDNRDSLKFYYEGATYSYGITDDNKEVIAFRDAKGNMLDALEGAGTYALVSTSNQQLLSVGGIASFEQTVIGNNIALIVKYRAVGMNTQNAILETTYVFGLNNLSISARVSYSGNQAISGSKSRIGRRFLNGYTTCKKTLNYGWTYPEDGDDPYREVESWVTINRVDDKHKIYTFVRSEDIPERYWDHQNRYPEANIPLFFEEGNGVDYTASFDLVLETEAEGRNSDYLALFASQNADYAAGIAPVTPNDDASTVFVGDEVEFNINVTNLSDADTDFSLRYDIMDYYGNVVDAGIYIDSTVFKGLDANRRIKVSGKDRGLYGIYFINLLVVSHTHTHQEMYPFLLLPNYDYKHRATSPFGINQILGGPNEPYLDYLSVASKIGVANTRGAGNVSTSFEEDSIAFLNEAKKRGIHVIGHGTTPAYLNAFSKYLDEVVVGNELNMPTISDGTKMEQAFTDYKANYFDFGYEWVHQKFNLKHVTAGIAGVQARWMEEIYNRGLWDKCDILAIHPYGYPQSPDLSTGPANQIWHVEHGLQRYQAAIKAYGYKPAYVTETGYPTPPGNKTAVSLRTQAEYNTRCFVLSLAYGVQKVMAYCFLDYSNSGIGSVLGDVEYHFGHFYYPDYFGRIMPKPSAASFAGMTRTLESVQKLSINDQYTKGTVRAFTAETQDKGKLLVLWSNCAPQPNDKLSNYAPRDPKRPWENQWGNSEKVTLKTTGDKVVVTDVMGNEKTYTAKDRQITLELNGAPVYVSGVL